VSSKLTIDEYLRVAAWIEGTAKLLRGEWAQPKTKKNLEYLPLFSGILSEANA